MTSPPSFTLLTRKHRHGRRSQESSVTSQVTKNLPGKYARYGKTSNIGELHDFLKAACLMDTHVNSLAFFLN